MTSLDTVEIAIIDRLGPLTIAMLTVEELAGQGVEPAVIKLDDGTSYWVLDYHYRVDANDVTDFSAPFRLIVEPVF